MSYGTFHPSYGFDPMSFGLNTATNVAVQSAASQGAQAQKGQVAGQIATSAIDAAPGIIAGLASLFGKKPDAAPQTVFVPAPATEPESNNTLLYVGLASGVLVVLAGMGVTVYVMTRD